MGDLFPHMTEYLEGKQIGRVFVYWFVALVLLPFVMEPLALSFFSEDAFVWVEIIYCLINVVALALILREYLTDAFMDVQFNLKRIIAVAAIALSLMLAWVILLWQIQLFLPVSVIDCFPITPRNVVMSPAFTAIFSPVLGTLSLTLLAPFCVCCLFYAPGFSPLCADRPWAAYLVMAGVVLVASFFDVYWLSGIVGTLIVYIIRLPVHLFACWSYQKTDNIWTPMFALAGFNLLTSLIGIILTSLFA